MLGIDVVDIRAVLVGLQQQEALLVFRIAEPLEVDATGLGLAGLGVPVNFIEEGLGVLRLDVELYVDQNHEPHSNALAENVQKALPTTAGLRSLVFVGVILWGLLVEEVLRHIDVSAVVGLGTTEASAVSLGHGDIAVKPIHAVLRFRLGELVDIAAAFF